MKFLVVLSLLLGLTYSCIKTPNSTNQLLKGEWVDANQRHFEFYRVEGDTGTMRFYSELKENDSSSHAYIVTSKAITLRTAWHGHTSLKIKRIRKNSVTLITGAEVVILSRP